MLFERRELFITSLNLYEFSQVNNNEMGVAVSRSEDSELYREAYDEAQRIIRISDEVRISLEKITSESEKNEKKSLDVKKENYSKLTTSKLAKKLGKTTDQLTEILVSKGYLEIKDEKEEITKKGKEVGGESKKGRFGVYFLWNENFTA